METARNTRRTGYGLLALFLILSAGIGSAGYYYHQRQERETQRGIRTQLAAIADVKVRQIAQWRKDHLVDAHAMLANPVMLPAVKRALGNPPAPGEVAVLLGWMKNLAGEVGFVNVALYDLSGKERLAVFPGRDASHASALAAEAMRTRREVLADLHRAVPDGKNEMQLAVPLSEAAGSQPVGAFVVWLDPQDLLFPLVQSWPTPSRTAETLLVRREGNAVVYLNELRHRKDTALRFRLPLGDPGLVSAKALSGGEGILDGNDYRGVPVLAAARWIPDSPWLMIAKIDSEEVFAEVRSRSASVAAIIALLIALTGAGVGMLWRQQQAGFYRQRAKADEERRALVGHFDYLSRYANDIILLADEDGRIIEANERAVLSYGFSREELLKMNIRDLRDPAVRAGFAAAWEASQKGALFETLQRRKDGSSFPVEISARSIDVDGTVFRQGIIRDITERKRAQAAVEESERLHRLLTDNVLDMISQHGPDGVIRYVTPSVERLLGYRPEELIGKMVEIAAPPDAAEEAWKAIHSALEAGGDQYRVQHRMIRKDGREIWVETIGRLIRDGRGNLQEIHCAVRDITEGRRAEEALRESEFWLRESQHISRVGSYVFDVGTGTWTSSEVLDDIFGIGPDFDRSVAGWVGLLHPDHRQEMAGYLQREVLANKTPFSREYPILRANDGQVRWVSGKGELLLDGAGRVVKMIGTVQDITERKQAEGERLKLEEQLQQSRKLESIGRLAGGVAHDFNNLLTVINGYGELALKRVGDDETLRVPLEEIRRAGDLAAQLTQQLLAFSRKQVIQPRPLNLNVVVAESAEILRRLVGEDIEVLLSLGSPLGLVTADPGQMHQILMNLAANARDAMPEGGRLHIETMNVEMDAAAAAAHPEVRPGPHVLLAISDTGTGMDEATQRRIFEPFFTTKETGKGTGLGLSTVYGIVHQNQGWIGVYSEPGHWTTFKIYLPRNDAGQPAAQAPLFTPEMLRGTETVLVVEDQEEVRRLVTEVLKTYGYEVIAAGRGEEALSLAERHPGPIHLMITDVVMPGMNGRVLAGRLKRVRPHTKVLFMSGYTENVIAKSGVLDPGVDYIAKPFIPLVLATRIREMLG